MPSRRHGMSAHLHSLVIGGAAILAIAAIGVAHDYVISKWPQRKTVSILRVAVTRAAFADAVREIGRSRVEILPLAPYGNQIDDFALRTSDLLIVGGSNTDADITVALSDGLGQRGTVVDASGGTHPVAGSPGFSPPSTASIQPDANFWMDADNAVRMAEVIRDALISADSEHAEAYRENTLDYISGIREADAAYARDLHVCNVRVFVEGGDPHVSYLARRHNLLYFAVRPLPSGESPQLAAYADVAGRHDLGYVFRDSVEDPRIAESVARLSGASLLTLESGSAMDAQSIASFSLVQAMHSNLAALVRGMECRK
jgi:zinc transport system substrate-binding protein